MKFFTWRHRLYVLGISVGTAGLGALIGYGIDTVLDSSPKGLVIGVVLSFPVAQYFVIKLLRKTIS